MKSLKIILSFNVLILNFVCFNSCSNDSHIDLIEREKFIDILVDLHLADAILAQKNLHDSKLKDSTESYYNSIFKKYSITKLDFNYSLGYYNDQGEKFLVMYDEVIKEIQSKVPQKLNDYSIYKVFDFAKEDASILSDLRKYYGHIGRELWKKRSTYQYPKDSTTITIEHVEKFRYPCLFVLRSEYKVYPDDSTKNLKMEIEITYNDSTKQTAKTKIDKKDEKWHIYQTILKTDSSKKTKRVKVQILALQKGHKAPHLETRNISLRQYAPDKDTSTLPPLKVHEEAIEKKQPLVKKPDNKQKIFKNQPLKKNNGKKPK